MYVFVTVCFQNKLKSTMNKLITLLAEYSLLLLLSHSVVKRFIFNPIKIQFHIW